MHRPARSAPAARAGIVSDVTPAPTPSPVTPIFDDVDRWWREGGNDPTPRSMLSFPGASRDTRHPVRRPASTAAPRHLLG
jgi:hypothetical protein